ncbi:bifunctional HhH-GPD domain/Endonuclease III-like [Babesia duncani]|uniref:Endonuclease III homolog n=1 Tax=Babesia duncani TaxID=323732 RepID=A0AAD9PMN8_9APIC|nr:bifunctional HhH-GPD domain/Endonuclease III-like [Babesia duncani]
MSFSWRKSVTRIVAGIFFSFKLFVRGVQSLRHTIQRTYGWVTPGGVQVIVSKSTFILNPPMVKRKLEGITTNESQISNAKQQLDNLLNADIKLEHISASKPTVKNKALKISSKIGKELSYQEDPLELDYNTKTRPFTQVTPQDCPIPNFHNVWNAIAQFRNERNAPVDTMGAHCLADENENADVYQYQTLVACMLSSQTKDEVTAGAMEKLKKRGLNLECISQMSQEELDSLISKVGFHNTKAKHIKQATEMIKSKFGGKVPQTLQELVTLPGVGPKMANLVLQLAFNRIQGIAVDLHVHRIANRLGWVKTKTPEETRLKLQELLPKTLWAQVNHLLVGFGQTICTAAGPGCATCPANKWCPTGASNLAR